MGALIDSIREGQHKLPMPGNRNAYVLPRDKTLVFACVDARAPLNELYKVIGNYPDIIRNIAAQINGKAADYNGEEAAMLQRAISHDGINRIIVMGHTSCGGIAYCMHRPDDEKTALSQYVGQLDEARDEIIKRGGTDAEQRRLLEIASVMNTVRKLASHDVVNDALRRDAPLRIQGLLLHTASHELIDLTAGEQGFSNEPEPPKHEPKMLIICSKNGAIVPQNELRLANGQPMGNGPALIYRNEYGTINPFDADTNNCEAAIAEFACNHMHVEDIVILAHEEHTTEALRKQKETMLKSIKNMQAYPAVQEAMKRGLQVHGWLIDIATHRLYEMDGQGRFVAMVGSKTPEMGR